MQLQLFKDFEDIKDIKKIENTKNASGPVEGLSQAASPAKALTLWQPYAQAVAMGLKQYETRGWPTRYRGALAIHASVRRVSGAYQLLAQKYGIKELPAGVVVAVVRLVDCIPMTPDFIREQSPQELEWGDWQPGRWAWKLCSLQKLKEPVIAKGAQGLWNIKHVELPPPQ